MIGSARLVVPVHDTDHMKGRRDAPVQLVEYADFECPYCGLAYPIVKAIEKRFGHVLLTVFRNFPLPQHPHALAAAQSAEFAAENGRFWEMHDVLFEHQRALDVAHLLGYAERIGLDPKDLARALRQGTYLPLIEQQTEGGIASGVAGTPSFFVNGMLFEAEPTLENFSLAIETLLAPVR